MKCKRYLPLKRQNSTCIPYKPHENKKSICFAKKTRTSKPKRKKKRVAAKIQAQQAPGSMV